MFPHPLSLTPLVSEMRRSPFLGLLCASDETECGRHLAWTQRTRGAQHTPLLFFSYGGRPPTSPSLRHSLLFLAPLGGWLCRLSFLLPRGQAQGLAAVGACVCSKCLHIRLGTLPRALGSSFWIFPGSRPCSPDQRLLPPMKPCPKQGQ